MSLFNVIQGGIQFPSETLGNPLAKEIGDLISRETGQSNFAGTLEQTIDGKVPVKDPDCCRIQPGR